MFLRGTDAPQASGPTPLAPVGLFKLLDAFQAVLKRAQTDLAFEITAEGMSIQDRMRQLTELLGERREVAFDTLFEERVNIYDLVITFLALLEMAKRRLVRIYQADPHSPIHLRSTVVSEDSAEFGEAEVEAESVEAESVEAESVEAESVEAESVEAEPAEAEPAEAEPAEPAEAESAEAESVEAESVEAESVEAESVEAESVEAESVEAESVEAEPAEAEPAEAEPAEAEPAEPAEAESAEAAGVAENTAGLTNGADGSGAASRLEAHRLGEAHGSTDDAARTATIDETGTELTDRADSVDAQASGDAPFDAESTDPAPTREALRGEAPVVLDGLEDGLVADPVRLEEPGEPPALERQGAAEPEEGEAPVVAEDEVPALAKSELNESTGPTTGDVAGSVDSLGSDAEVGPDAIGSPPEESRSRSARRLFLGPRKDLLESSPASKKVRSTRRRRPSAHRSRVGTKPR